MNGLVVFLIELKFKMGEACCLSELRGKGYRHSKRIKFKLYYLMAYLLDHFN